MLTSVLKPLSLASRLTPLCLLVREGKRGSLSSKAASLTLQLQPLTSSRGKTLDKRAEPMVVQAGLAKASKTKMLDKSLPSLDKTQRLPCCSTFDKKVAPIEKKLDKRTRNLTKGQETFCSMFHPCTDFV